MLSHKNDCSGTETDYQDDELDNVSLDDGAEPSGCRIKNCHRCPNH